MERKKRESNYVECLSCKKTFDRMTRSYYCEDCRDSERKKKHAEQEKERRERKKDEINAKRREEYYTNPARKKMCNDASKRSYEKYMNDPFLKKDLNDRTKRHQSNYRQRTKYDGNGVKVLERDNYKCVKCCSNDMLVVHHIDGNGSNLPYDLQNNNLSNLVTLCASCHAREHREKEKEGKTSKYIGVWKRKDLWQASISHKGKRHYLGTFKTEEEAFDAYLRKKKELDLI